MTRSSVAGDWEGAGPFEVAVTEARDSQQSTVASSNCERAANELASELGPSTGEEVDRCWDLGPISSVRRNTFDMHEQSHFVDDPRSLHRFAFALEDVS